MYIERGFKGGYKMKNLILSALISIFLIIPMSRMTFAGDYFKNALLPEGADDRSCQIYPSNDFSNIIFTREYFYTLQEGMAQYDRTYGGTWNALDLGRQLLGIGQSNSRSAGNR
jgi:hypothetical protein